MSIAESLSDYSFLLIISLISLPFVGVIALRVGPSDPLTFYGDTAKLGFSSTA